MSPTIGVVASIQQTSKLVARFVTMLKRIDERNSVEGIDASEGALKWCSRKSSSIETLHCPIGGERLGRWLA